MTASLTLLWPKQERLRRPFDQLAHEVGLCVIKDEANPDNGMLLNAPGFTNTGIDSFPDATLAFRRADDAVSLLAADEGDMAIVGADTFEETIRSQNLDRGALVVLGACPDVYNCRMSFMAQASIQNWRDLRGRIVVTAFPSILAARLMDAGIRTQTLSGPEAKNADPNPHLVRIVPVSGSVEGMVAKGSFGATVGFDMIDTGGSMRRNGLLECGGPLRDVVGSVVPLIVASRKAFDNPVTRAQIDAFCGKLSGVMTFAPWSESPAQSFEAAA